MTQGTARVPPIEKIVVITQKTLLDELVERFNTRDQARFYIEHAGESFAEYQDAHDTYKRARDCVAAALPQGVRAQFVDRGFLPNFLFGERDLAVTLGRDGLVVNTAKYLRGQPLLAVNPDPARIDGVLIPFRVEEAGRALARAVEDSAPWTRVSMACAQLSDGQRILAVNDLFIGQRTHVSARYRLELAGRQEDQISSGIIVSTGAGSTGWFRSILTGAAEVVESYQGGQAVGDTRDRYRFGWDADYLYYGVREPFISRVSGAELVFGRVTAGEALRITSYMPQNGVIFSDGVEADRLDFNSGATARVGLADEFLRLVVPGA
jgi:NAD kinase